MAEEMKKTVKNYGDRIERRASVSDRDENDDRADASDR